MIAMIFLLLGVQCQSEDLNLLCTQMPGMPGCSLMNECKKDSTFLPSTYCSNSSLLADICMYDMPKMSGCSNFGNCNNCNPLPNLPTSKIATRAIYSICNEMNMDGCDQCKIANNASTYSNCPLLEIYGQLCREMPDMYQCEAWNQMCSTTKGISLCDEHDIRSFGNNDGSGQKTGGDVVNSTSSDNLPSNNTIGAKSDATLRKNQYKLGKYI